ncbi:testis-expressed protein 26-like [Erpetoichthys calabaricus]|uniref:Testis-expressed protein 26 n=1 Tax=Erpetoichthys calabaricus TaxID=27687 RepID=A0A8C4RS62_ERPCA|nr:testis-expressed protein 26-like [Erpetoichthys calabaricus]
MDFAQGIVTTQLNEDILKPEFREQLQFLKLRSTSEVERERCDKLAASLILTGHLNKERLKSGDASKRPKTAMASLGVKKHWDPYETTNNREFNYTPDTFTEAIRPKTSRAYAYPYERSDPIGNNSYSEEFCWKPFSKPEPIRSGSSSGNRRNNPQSSQSFIVWRIPHSEQKISVNSKSPWRKTYSEEELRRALKAQYRTTYEEDYMGIPQGFQIKHAIPVPSNWKKSILQCPETEFRRHFQQPQQNSELMVKTTRYGSNMQHQVATRGAVPTVTYAHIKNQENKKQMTTYQRMFGNNYLDISKVLKTMQPTDIDIYLRTVPEKDRDILERFLKTCTLKFKNSTNTLSDSSNKLADPAWLSVWPGPL